MTFCIDFDGTLTEKSPYPITGKLIPSRINQVIQLKKDGHKVILFTARSGDDLSEAITLCREAGLEFDEVYGNKPRSNFYVDDKAVLPEDFFKS